MADKADEATPGGAGNPEGVFGNLPSTRPGSRSPRRRASPMDEPKAAAIEAEAVERQPAATPKRSSAPKPKPSGPPKPKLQTKAPQPKSKAEPPAEPQQPEPGIHGVEDLTWAGVAVAAQVATAGVRFASRALETARKSIDRP